MVNFGDFEDSDFTKFELFKGRIDKLISSAIKHKSRLYLDAEQTYIQTAIEMFGQQIIFKHNREDKVYLMNCY
jgi:hypothetical protein